MLARKACARTRGPEGSRPGARQLVGRGSPSPPLNRESLETYRRFVCRSANGGLGEPALPKAAAALKGGSIGRPDDWLGTYIRGREDLRSRGPEELAPGFRRLMAERLIPERLTTVTVTRHPESIIPAGNIPVSGFPLIG